MRTAQQAMQDAINSGAVEAWVDGLAVQFADAQLASPTWHTMLAGNYVFSMPEFADGDLVWRPAVEGPTLPQVTADDLAKAVEARVEYAVQRKNDMGYYRDRTRLVSDCVDTGRTDYRRLVATYPDSQHRLIRRVTLSFLVEGSE